MARGWLEIGFKLPDPVLFVAYMIRIDVARIDDLFVFQIVRVEVIVVVGNVGFLPTFDGPRVAVRGAIVSAK